MLAQSNLLTLARLITSGSADETAARAVARSGADPIARTVDQVASLSFDTIRDRAGLEALEGEWNALFERAGCSTHVFQTFNWCWHWCNHFLPPVHRNDSSTTLHVLAARRAGRLVMIWPLVLERVAGFRRLAFLGAPVSQYGDILVDSLPDRKQALAEAFAHLVASSGADVLHLRKVRADANIAEVLHQCGALELERTQAPYLDLSSAPDFATYETRFSSKARKNRRRLLRRFEDRSPAVLTEYRNSGRARQMAELALMLKRAWLKDKGLVSPALADARTNGFFMDAAEGAIRPVGCTITSLESRGEATALEIAFDCKGRRAVHVLVYALKYERLSPGQLLIERSIKQAFAEGFSTYDLLAPADAYKLEWADATVDVADWAYGVTLKGRLFARHYLGHLHPRLKAVVKRFAQALRRRRKPTTPEQPAD